MWSKLKFVVVFLIPFYVLSQKEYKPKKENYLHFKVGMVFNFTNTELIKSLNISDENVFTSNKSINCNPSADVEFEHCFSKHFGLNIDFGFLQTRQRYRCNYLSGNYQQDGAILGNVGHFNVNPSFFIKSTTVYFGAGIYKYYYSFNPRDLGSGRSFNPNSEGYAIYSSIGITQNFEINTYTFTAGISYFGLSKKYDSGFQLSLGMAL